MNKEQQELLDDAYENYEKHNDGIFGRKKFEYSPNAKETLKSVEVLDSDPLA